MRRFFSSTTASGREWAHIVCRRFAPPRYFNLKPGDPDTLLPARANRLTYPPYPYGEATTYKQSNRGLYGGKTLQYGHQISEFGNKHVRVFRPNVQRVSLWSETLKRTLKLRVVTSVLRTITKEGGLDNYLLKDSSARIKELGPLGWRLRFDVLQRIAEHKRTAPKPLGPEFRVGRTRLVKDLFLTNNEGLKLRQFMDRYSNLEASELLQKLRDGGADVSKYIN